MVKKFAYVVTLFYIAANVKCIALLFINSQVESNGFSILACYMVSKARSKIYLFNLMLVKNVAIESFNKQN